MACRDSYDGLKVGRLIRDGLISLDGDCYCCCLRLRLILKFGKRVIFGVFCSWTRVGFP